MPASLPRIAPGSQRLSPRKVLSRAALQLLAISPLGCVIWDLGGDKVHEVVHAGTLTADAARLTHMQEDLEYRQTIDAAEYERMTQRAGTAQAAQLTNTAEAPPSPPSILDIEFPAVIPGDGTTYYGKLHFRDRNGDVNRITIDVVQSASFGSSDYDPRDYIVAGDHFSGAIQLHIWCEGQQLVTLRTTLWDASGLRSNSLDFAFACQ